MKTPLKSRVKIDPDRNEVFLDGNEVRLSHKEYLLLTILKASGKTMSRKQLLDEIWGSSEVDTRTVDQHASRVRRKLFPGVILTVPNVGYKIARA